MEVLHYERVNKNKIIGYVDIKFTVQGVSFILRKIAHFQSGDRKWFNLATFMREGEENNYLRFFQFETEVYNNQLLEALAEKVKEFCEAHGIEEVQPLDLDSAPESNIIDLPF